MIIFLIFIIHFKSALFFLFFLLLDRIIVFLSQKTDFALGIEHTSIVAILFGYYYNIFFALFATLVMMFIVQHRNIKITFVAASIDGFIWIVFPFASALMAASSISIGTVGIILPVIRYLVKEVLNIVLGFQVHNVLKNTMNMFYQVFFLKYIGAFFGMLML